MKAAKEKVVESKTISRGVLEFLNNPSKPLLPIFVVTSRLVFSLSLWSIFLTYCLNKKSSVCSSEPNRTKEPPGRAIQINCHDDQSLGESYLKEQKYQEVSFSF